MTESLLEAELLAEKEQIADEVTQVEREIAALVSRKAALLERRMEIECRIQRAQAAAINAEERMAYDRVDFPWSEKVDDLLKSVFRLSNFRSHQRQTINATLSGKDCLLVMPTGGGKSLCYQLPALVPENGFTLVVSPLISLIEDQIHALSLINVPAATLNASTNATTTKQVMEAMVDKKAGASRLRLLYVTPEKLAKSKRFLAKLEKSHELGLLQRVAIDEVHCCSQWGHDFRPDYKFLGFLRRQFPGVPTLGLTATATVRVLNDVEQILSLGSSPLVLRASYNRANLFYEVTAKPASATDALDCLADLLTRRYSGQSGIVYCFSQKDSYTVAMGLREKGISAACYHANMEPEMRTRIHQRWIANKLQVVVATIAFGMGIDKPDVRFVIHFSPSKSLENYYQESGRAGRDDCHAECLILFKVADAYRLSGMVVTEEGGLRNLYAMLRFCLAPVGCRRVLMAARFAERWSADDCGQQCDLCRRELSSETAVREVDLGSFLETILSLIETQKSVKKQPKVTALRMAEILSMKEHAELIKPLVSEAVDDRRVLVEKMILFLILESYLREDFHFTPYSTISYLAPGSRILKVGTSISFHLLRYRRVPSKAPSIDRQPSLKIVNPTNSKLVTKRQLSTYAPDDGNEEKSPKTKKPRREVSSTVDSALDFGNDLEPLDVTTTEIVPQMISSDSDDDKT